MITKDHSDPRFCGRCNCKLKLESSQAAGFYCKFSHQTLTILPQTGGKALRSTHCLRHYGV